MTNFKSGSGNLDFGDDGDDDGTDEGSPESAGASRSAPPGTSDGASPTQTDGPDETGDEGDDGDVSTGDADGSGSGTRYPYFVRRNNVGDERDRRLEVHVRDDVAERESEFRAELADRLGVSEVSKTDAREFALLAAYEHPERVAELLREEGFGAVD
jgi:hypothetical protein